MRKIHILTIVLLLNYFLTIIASAGEIDAVDIKEAFRAGLLSLEFTGSEDMETMKIRVEKTIQVPLIIIIDKGVTTFSHSSGEISIIINEKIRIDLSDAMQDMITVKQTGKAKMSGTMSTEFRMSKLTAPVYVNLKYSKNQMLKEIIAKLGDDSAWIRWGAAEALGEIADKQAVTELKRSYSEDPDDRVRKAAGEALNKIDNINK
jgi:hypothetical protein